MPNDVDIFSMLDEPSISVSLFLLNLVIFGCIIIIMALERLYYSFNEDKILFNVKNKQNKQKNQN